MSDKTSDKSDKIETPVQPADALVKSGKDATVELTEDELGKVSGGIIFVGGKKAS